MYNFFHNQFSGGILKRSSLFQWIIPLFFLFQPVSALATSEPVQAELIAEEQSIQPGRAFWVGVELKMEDGWDTYWMNPGDSGFPTQVNWQLPEGFTAGPLEWPYPETFINESLVAFGYTDTVLLLSKISPPKNLTTGQPVILKADVNWLACKNSCVPGNAHLSLSLPVSHALPKANEQSAPLFAQARQTLPQQLEAEEGNLTVQTKSDEIVMNFKPKPGSFGEIEQIQFIPQEDKIIDYTAPQPFQIKREGVTLNVKMANPENSPESVKGVLLVSEKGSTIKRAIQIDIPTDQVIAPVHHEGISSVGIALIFAFLGGLILNVMPCVLPVIALKIFGFVKMAHHERSVILQQGAVFSLGVLISFWILSGALLILRAYGEGIGWGFQLQEPIFVAVLAAVLFLLALSLFGVFEFGTSMISLGNKTTSSTTSPLKSSFMSGILATLVATPCTGPLLGPALGFAMTLPPIQALMIFTMMGLGMAFPYLLFSAFPNLIRFLPKPGHWMVTFKQFMGFLMMATVIWLVWVFGAQTDNMATFILLSAFLILAVACWIFGRWGTPTRRKRTRMLALFTAALIFCMGSGAMILTAKQYRDITSPPSGNGVRLISDQTWEMYAPERVEKLRAQGIPVFVDFTAKWCLICQANKVTLHSGDITKAFKEKGVVTMTADWTKKDSVITQELDKLGRTGVPVYALYPGDLSEKPHILPQTLTGKVVREYLNQLKTPKTTVYATD